MVIHKENERILLQEKSLIIPIREFAEDHLLKHLATRSVPPGLYILISTPTQDEGTVTGHDILREAARRDLENYTEKMVNQMNKERKRVKHYEIGDLVRMKIDRFGVDCPTLPCKVLKK